MQYPVPQFTDVEDKIFGPLTLKQFGIVGTAGAIIFVSYSLTKDLLITIFVGLLFGVPALGLAFGKLNGRPLYTSIFSLIGFYFKPRMMLFHKEGYKEAPMLKQIERVALPESQSPIENPSKRIKSLYYTLDQQQAVEEKLVHASEKKG
jgi:hypothetical protein